MFDEDIDLQQRSVGHSEAVRGSGREWEWAGVGVGGSGSGSGSISEFSLQRP